jgi:hypothetical protein
MNAGPVPLSRWATAGPTRAGRSAATRPRDQRQVDPPGAVHTLPALTGAGQGGDGRLAARACNSSNPSQTTAICNHGRKIRPYTV